MRILSAIAMVLIAIIQIPSWLWAKLRGKGYEWWGGPQ